MSGMWVFGKNFSITKYVMSDDIDDIQDPRYHMRRRTFFQRVTNVLFTWVCMGLDGSTCSESLPERTCHFEPHSTCHGPWLGPKLACGVRTGSLRATEPRARGKTRGRKRKRCRRAKKTHIYICRPGKPIKEGG